MTRPAPEDTPFTKPRKARKGNNARKGRGWEAQLKVWHDDYRKAGTAWVVQTSAKIARVGEYADGRFEARYTKGGPPDFAGVARGVAVVFDAKDCATDRWALSQVADHLAKHLDDAVKAGAFAFIALRLTTSAGAPRCWVVSWEYLAPLWRRGGTIGIAELNGDTGGQVLGLPMREDGWLSAVQAFADVSVLVGRGRR